MEPFLIVANRAKARSMARAMMMLFGFLGFLSVVSLLAIWHDGAARDYRLVIGGALLVLSVPDQFLLASYWSGLASGRSSIRFDGQSVWVRAMTEREWRVDADNIRRVTVERGRNHWVIRIAVHDQRQLREQFGLIKWWTPLGLLWYLGVGPRGLTIHQHAWDRGPEQALELFGDLAR